jgi:hypothetical protein
MPTSVISTTVRTDIGSITIPSVSVTADGSLAYDDMVPAATTNKEITLAVDVSAVKVIAIAVEGIAEGKTVTIKTNSTSSPTNTLTLTRSAPGVVWYTGQTGANPLTADVTSFYVSSDDTAPRRLRIYVGADVTP